MDRSQRFRVCNQRLLRPYQTCFRFGFASRLNLAADHNSLAHDTKGTPSSFACAIALRLLVNTRFQILFTPLAGVLFTFPSRYLCTIGRQGVLSLGRWSSQLQTGFLVSRLTRGVPRAARTFAYRALTFYGWPSQAILLALTVPRRAPTTPAGILLVWAFPRSLATTRGVSFDFFSWRYLDVSVPSVRFLPPMYSAEDDGP